LLFGRGDVVVQVSQQPTENGWAFGVFLPRPGQTQLRSTAQSDGFSEVDPVAQASAGWFPASYITFSQGQAIPLARLKASFDGSSFGDDYISAQSGRVMIIVDAARTENGTAWVKVRPDESSQQEGWVPAGFLELRPPPPMLH